MIEKAYVRFRESLPDNQNTFAAADGFTMQGVPVVPYYGFGDLREFFDKGELTKNTIVCGHIGDIWEVLGFFGKQAPPPVDYPPHLKWFLGREIVETTLEEVRGRTDVFFVKPVQQKIFTGFVWDPADPRSRLNIAVCPDDTPVLRSDIIEFESEWRCFVRHDELVGVKHYKGDPSLGFDMGVLKRAIADGRGKMPAAHSLDIGLSRTGRTYLVEANEGYAIGSYGLTSLIYARFLEARWEELML